MQRGGHRASLSPFGARSFMQAYRRLGGGQQTFRAGNIKILLEVLNRSGYYKTVRATAGDRRWRVARGTSIEIARSSEGAALWYSRGASEVRCPGCRLNMFRCRRRLRFCSALSASSNILRLQTSVAPTFPAFRRPHASLPLQSVLSSVHWVGGTPLFRFVIWPGG